MEIRIMKLKELKSLLKELAAFNRKYKAMYKDCQRGKVQWAELYAFQRTGPIGNYRYMHIAYCLLRGRTYEQIENKVRPGNEPSWTAIEAIMERFRDVEPITCSEVICG
jgi:hypothetical protein